MVDAGEGKQSGSDWWVVAAAVYDLAGPSAGPTLVRHTLSWLTDTPSLADPTSGTWIGLYATPGGPTTWTSVNWTGERLARGQAAQAKAESCLPGS